MFSPEVAMYLAQRWLLCSAQRWCVQPRGGLGPELAIYVYSPEVATVCSAQRWLCV